MICKWEGDTGPCKYSKSSTHRLSSVERKVPKRWASSSSYLEELGGSRLRRVRHVHLVAPRQVSLSISSKPHRLGSTLLLAFRNCNVVCEGELAWQNIELTHTLEI